jgi:hypothetical protein
MSRNKEIEVTVTATIGTGYHGYECDATLIEPMKDFTINFKKTCKTSHMTFIAITTSLTGNRILMEQR